MQHETGPGGQLTDLFGGGIYDNVVIDGRTVMTRRLEDGYEPVRLWGPDAGSGSSLGPQLAESGRPE